jgi:hypothetical protein
VPRGFHLSKFNLQHHCVVAKGAWISNFEFEIGRRSRPPAAFPSHGIAVRFALVPDIEKAGRDSPLPIHLGDFKPAQKRAKDVRARQLEVTVIVREHLYGMTVWLGPSADKAVVEAMVASLRFDPNQRDNGFVMVSSSLP